MARFSWGAFARRLRFLTGSTLVAAAALGAADRAEAAEPAACLSSNPASWPSPSKPYFMVIVDTSGSMSTGVGSTDSCGYGTARIDHARCAVRNSVRAFAGQANFGLAGYAWKQSGCSGATCFTGCGSTYASNDSNACGPLISEPTLGLNVHSGAEVFVPMLQDRGNWVAPGTPDASNVPEIVSWVDNDCTNSKELGRASNTPLGGSLFNMNQYYSGVFKDPFTGTTLASPIGTAAQGEKACRSLNVILITDGDENGCDEGRSPTPVVGGCRNGQTSYLNTNGERLATYEADRMWTTGVTVGGQTFHVKTHVIGFAGATPAALDHIAACGGTSASYSTSNEAQLATALAKIIQGAVPPETCDNSDNNCNGCTDEGYKHYCDVGQTCCSGARATCLAAYQASITPANPQGDPTLLPCVSAAQSADPAQWLCYNPKDVCDSVDNNCDGDTDEASTKCGSPLHCPLAESCDGQDNNCDGIIDNAAGNSNAYSLAGCTRCTPSAEVCDGCDNDCDGVADNGLSGTDVACGLPAAAGVPAYCTGVQTCRAQAAVSGPNACEAGGPGNFYTTCSAAGPFPAETCNGLDDDCNGSIDDNITPAACDVPGSPGLVYKDVNPASQCVRGAQPCGGTCTGYVGPSAEVCDGIDNDCDGVVDDGALPGTGVACGNATAPCTKGTTACVGGALVCQGGHQPQPETCNGIDDDCDGVTDDQPQDAPAGAQRNCWSLAGATCSYGATTWSAPSGATCTGVGSLATPCSTGTLACVSGAWACQGGIVPAAEVCDGVDNNCNGVADDGAQGVGDACGSSVGQCRPGALACTGGKLTCIGGTVATKESCNAKDDDCNGVTDDGVIAGVDVACTAAYDATLFPGPRSGGSCTSGITACVAGGIVCQGGSAPAAEVCDGKDNDCDGLTDEAGSAPDGVLGSVDPAHATIHVGDACGQPGGVCRVGAYECKDGAVTCVGGVGPAQEVCDGVDNDCDGQTDEGTLPGVGNACGTTTPPCTKGTTACVGGALVCSGGTQPQPEVCNGVDDNCNGIVDDSPSDAPTGADALCWDVPGNCCAFSGLAWCPPSGAGCHDVGSLALPCRAGTITCTSGSWTCAGAKSPSAEVCDGKDNDCNGQVDEAFASQPCGSNVGACASGATACSAGQITCVGGKGPELEQCNGIDDNCNGITDEGISLNEACDPPYDTSKYPHPLQYGGRCRQGTTVCDGHGGTFCQGGVGPEAELCNGVDDDCDGLIDEAGVAPDGIDGSSNPTDATQAIGGACGSDVGACKKGTWTCTNSTFVCTGGVGPQSEVCDCLDNDCNGTIDDDPVVTGGGDAGTTTLPICPGTQPSRICVAYQGSCQCAQRCASVEQGNCPTGPYTCEVVSQSGASATGPYCVTPPCGGDCAQRTVSVALSEGGTRVECEPRAASADAGANDVPECVCKGQLGCHSPCYGVVCDAPSLCAAVGPKAGNCVQNNCYNIPCPGSELCDLGGCVPNPCDGKTCPAGQFCKPSADFKSSSCVDSCANVSCQKGEVCHLGVCEPTGCANGCPQGQVCVAEAGLDGGGQCEPSKCDADANPCSNGGYCDPKTGACGNDPCEGIDCPSGQRCSAGDCVAIPVDAGVDANDSGLDATVADAADDGATAVDAGGQPAAERGVFGLATGGGGCACEVGARSTSGRDGARAALAVLALGAALARRRRRVTSRSASAREGGSR